MTTPPRRRARYGDDGAASADLLCWVVAALLLLGFAVYTIRGVTASIDVADAADAAARAASLAPTATAAVTAATAVAATEDGGACQQTRVRVDTSRFRPGGIVTVTVTCAIVIADLPITGLRSHLTASASAPIDTYITTVTR